MRQSAFLANENITHMSQGTILDTEIALYYHITSNTNDNERQCAGSFFQTHLLIVLFLFVYMYLHISKYLAIW